MKLEMLLSGLNSPQPAVRLDVVRVLGMLDETRALDALRARYAVETDPAVREAISWAGKRLYHALQAGYSTIDELFHFFRVDREIETSPDAKEAQVLRELQDKFDRDMLNRADRAGLRKAGTAIAAGLGGAALGGTMMGMRMMADALAPGSDVASSGLGVGERVLRRTPATAPANTDIELWVRRLQTAARPEEREQAAIELQQRNNPRALPYLAKAFLTDESPRVRQAAQRYGKILYWSAIYWDMDQSGELAAEMKRRADALGKEIVIETHGATVKPALPAPPTLPGAGTAPPSAAPEEEPEVDVGEILRRAQEARERRKSQKR